MIAILTCNGYRVEATTNSIETAVRMCRELEDASADGYGRVVTQDGVIVADRDGEYPEEQYVDVATRVGMYDYE
jgi:hypothetical protein